MNSLKQISEYCVINGISQGLDIDLLPSQPPSLRRQHLCSTPPTLHMAENLHSAIQAMSLHDDDPIDLPDDPCSNVFDGNSLSILGRLLNPARQQMDKMIEDMPRVWRVYGRVRGIALSAEKFQFIFQREEDMITVLNDHPWTYYQWTMLLDRWIPSPPANFLSSVDVWVRIFHIPVNHYNIDTMNFLASKIGHVLEIAYDPKVSQKELYIRAQV
ncbi:uncharacterized protein LOC130509983 [Raphanus sativus]|uniref:Uncharacterized protein LOC130509983 n=1 Tax=Raphanus sativus TaxID=3726 RepID=A0A9W3DEQ4_RAPSA|nr:uncharacterized protein LOC130509983 [Raphanus sativus]